MPDENVNESEETENAVEEPHTTAAADVEAVGDEEVSDAAEPEVGVADESVEPEAADDPEPMAAETVSQAEAEASEPEAAADATAEPAEAEADPEPMAAEAEPVDAAEEPAAEVEEAPAESASEPAAEVEAAPARKKKKKRLPRSLRPQRTKTKREKSAERKAITRLPKPEHLRGRRQERRGRVVSASADKTIVVRVDVAKVHPMYKKVIKRSTRFHAHDEENQAKVGDIVRIVETRPLSRMKRWRLQEIVEAAK